MTAAVWVAVVLLAFLGVLAVSIAASLHRLIQLLEAQHAHYGIPVPERSE